MAFPMPELAPVTIAFWSRSGLRMPYGTPGASNRYIGPVVYEQWIGSIHFTSSGASTGAMSRFTTTGSWPLRTSTHSSGSFFFQAEDGIRDYKVTGVQTCALPI